jgi:hypothetical protein
MNQESDTKEGAREGEAGKPSQRKKAIGKTVDIDLALWPGETQAISVWSKRFTANLATAPLQ